MIISKQLTKFIWYSLTELGAEENKDPRLGEAVLFFAKHLENAKGEDEEAAIEVGDLPEEIIPSVRLALEKYLFDHAICNEAHKDAVEIAWRKACAAN